MQDANRADRISEYMLSLFRSKLCAMTNGPPQPTISLSRPSCVSKTLTREIRSVVDGLVHAVLNPVHMSWDAEEYMAAQGKISSHKRGAGLDEQLFASFPPWASEIVKVQSCRTAVDCNGRILAWMLPRILPRRLQDQLTHATIIIKEALHQNRVNQARKSESWRASKYLFKPVNGIAGLINMSPAWFMQGWAGNPDGLRTSHILQTALGQDWMEMTWQAGALMSGMLHIMHPEQYSMAHALQTRLREISRLRVPVSQWNSVFTAMSLIANRTCPFHLDEEGHAHWYDLLCSVGDYKEATMELKTLGFQIPNPPGTIVAFSGTLIPHSVDSADGSRFSHIFYMRKNLPPFFNLRLAGWMTQDYYTGLMGSQQAKDLKRLHRPRDAFVKY
ncbi:hypothetical protein QCA50_020936 [Cerrena zonata]|uniref:2OGFeDO JBP1/TET oxygenase domain-containing protein n=1 Tax=Cerrena zonata TaxID=2478898 RepID=A0AAW0FFS1_9APHY